MLTRARVQSPAQRMRRGQHAPIVVTCPHPHSLTSPPTHLGSFHLADKALASVRPDMTPAPLPGTESLAFRYVGSRHLTVHVERGFTDHTRSRDSWLRVHSPSSFSLALLILLSLAHILVVSTQGDVVRKLRAHMQDAKYPRILSTRYHLCYRVTHSPLLTIATKRISRFHTLLNVLLHDLLFLSRCEIFNSYSIRGI